MKKLSLLGAVLVLSCSCVLGELSNLKCLQHGKVVYDGPVTRFLDYGDEAIIINTNEKGERIEQTIRGGVSCTKTYRKQEEEQEEYYLRKKEKHYEY